MVVVVVTMLNDYRKDKIREEGPIEVHTRTVILLGVRVGGGV